MAQRVQLRTRKSYNTKSNDRKVVKTPGGKLVYQKRAKRASVPKCGDTHVALHGIPALRPTKYARLSKNKKTVNRAYGGALSANSVRDRIIRAFVVEEAKVVKALAAKGK